ncbi:TMEM175 family protein [Humibacter sp.]|uniref:TMEM175 family protein n=1 Tax=Humibacter sp. TaxID=1940291 RepID=UPI003F7E2924
MPDDATKDSTVDDDMPKSLSSRRLEAYSDGVFAIAATLLVLNLSVDSFHLKNPSSAQVWNALGDSLPNLISFVVSFLILGVLWGIHVRQFEFVERVDQVVLTLNTFRLLGVVLVPFTTTLTDEFSNTVPGRFLLPLNFFYVVTIGLWQWWYASSPTRDLAPHLSDRYRRLSRRNALVAGIMSAVVAVASIWIGSYAFLLFLLNNVVDVADRREAKKEPGRRTRAERRARD